MSFSDRFFTIRHKVILKILGAPVLNRKDVVNITDHPFGWCRVPPAHRAVAFDSRSCC